MNQLQTKIIEELIKPQISRNPPSTEGHILELFDKNMFADVRITSMASQGQQTLRKVPVQMGSGGFSQSGPFKGDKVIVTFKNGNPLLPVVTSIIESNFDANWQQTRTKHSRKGSLCTDSICDRKDWNLDTDMYASESSFDYLK